MCTTFEPLPSPLMGEGAGGGEDSTSSPHPNLPPPRGEGVLTYPCQPLAGEDPGGGKAAPVFTPIPTLLHRGAGERWLTGRSSGLMSPASAAMWGMLSPQGEGGVRARQSQGERWRL
jgi:hypothetical protein